MKIKNLKWGRKSAASFFSILFFFTITFAPFTKAENTPQNAHPNEMSASNVPVDFVQGDHYGNNISSVVPPK